jgi:predicted unusual protein kinase regulating ubiquinone biosynthesis (AarF/ABC1/UbiB family)
VKRQLAEEGVTGVYVPEVFPELSTRKVLVSEWVDGVKLSECEPEEIKELIAIGQEAFLVQLLQTGVFHRLGLLDLSFSISAPHKCPL